MGMVQTSTGTPKSGSDLTLRVTENEMAAKQG